MSKKRNTSLVAFHCPDALLTEIDDLAYMNMMDRTEYIVAAVGKFVEYVEGCEERKKQLLMQEVNALYTPDTNENGEVEEEYELFYADDSDGAKQHSS